MSEPSVATRPLHQVLRHVARSCGLRMDAAWNVFGADYGRVLAGKPRDNCEARTMCHLICYGGIWMWVVMERGGCYFAIRIS